MKNVIDKIRRIKIKNLVVIIFFLCFTILTLNSFSQNKCVHHDDHSKCTSATNDSAFKIVEALKRDDGAGEAIIIQRHRDDPAADKWLEEYLNITRKKITNYLKGTKASGCSNLDFEDGSFTNWIGQTGTNSGYPAGSWVNGFAAGRHTIVTGGTDPYGGFPMLAPNGGAVSVKLGNDGTNYEAEQLIYTFVVQPQDTNFIYKYAVVLQDPAHTFAEQPYFELKIYDGASNIIPCSYQQYVASGSIPGFQSNGDIRYKPWTTVGINLGAYIGQLITILVTSADCAQGAHFGYGYIDFICPSSFSLDPNYYCDNVTSATLNIPDIDPGMVYHWSTGETTPTITFNPQLYDGSSINVYIESPTSVGLCGFWYAFPIEIVSNDPQFTFTTNCLTATFTDASTTNSGAIQSWLWDFGDGSTAATQNTSHSYSSSGTYNVTLTVNTAACGSESITHSVTVTGMGISISSTNIMCYGGNNATATVSPSSGSPPYTYSWNTTPPQNSPTATGLPAGTYTVLVSDNGGCTNTASVTITEPPIFQSTITSTDVSCYGGNNGNATVTITGGTTPYSIAWSNSQNGLTANNLTAGPYSVTVTDVNLCTTTASITISQPAQLAISATATPTSICSGGSSTLTANGASTYVWSPATGLSATTGTSVTATPGATTTYNITGTDAIGCTATTTVTVTINPSPSISITGTSPICSGQSSTLTGIGGVSYLWDNGTIAGNITVSPATTTTYSVIGTNASSCTGTATYTVTVIPMPIANAGLDNAVCQLTYTLQAVPSVGTGTWTVASGPGTVMFDNPNSPNANISVSTSGTYTLTWTEDNGNGCTDQDDVTLQLTLIPTSIFTASQIPCFGDASTINYIGSGNSLCTYTWNFNGGNAFPGSGSGPHTVTWLSSGPQNISLTVSLNGCISAPTTVSVNNPPPLVSSITSTDILCNGQVNGTVDLTVTGGTPNPTYQYSWSNLATTEDITGLGAGIYSVIVTDFNGCTITNGITIFEPSELQISTNPSMSICYNQPAYLTASASGGTGPSYNFLWSNGLNSNSISVTPLTNTSYTVTVTDQNGCTAFTSVTVYVSPPINVTLIPNTDSVCPGDPVMLTPIITGGVGPPYMLINQDGVVVSPPILVYPTISDFYSVFVEDGCGTKDTGSVYIHVMPLPPINIFSNIDNGCQPLTVNFNEIHSDSGQTYIWNFGDNENLSLNHNPTHTFNSSGVFTVSLTVTSAFGCKNTEHVTDMITVWPKPNAQFTWSPEFASIIKPIVSFINMTTNGNTYIWTFSDGDSSSIVNPVHRFPDAGSWPVQLIAISEMGCRDTVMYPVVIQEEHTFYAPSAFSPDFDEKNDEFYIIAHGIKETGFYLAVLDRWGEVIWDTDKYSEATEQSNKWDGKAKNHEIVQIGTYTWFAKYKDFMGNDHEKAGAITVIR